MVSAKYGRNVMNLAFVNEGFVCGGLDVPGAGVVLLPAKDGVAFVKEEFSVLLQRRMALFQKRTPLPCRRMALFQKSAALS